MKTLITFTTKTRKAAALARRDWAVAGYEVSLATKTEDGQWMVTVYDQLRPEFRNR